MENDEPDPPSLLASFSNLGVPVTGGFDVHAVFESAQRPHAVAVYERFMAFVETQQISHLRPLVFDEPVGPWPSPMWQVLLPQSERVQQDLKTCLEWLIQHRDGLSIMVHPNTERQGQQGGMVADHTDHAQWLGPSLPLRLADYE